MNTVNIVYKGETLASLYEGQVAKLGCAGRTMSSDIVITFGTSGSVTYNNVKSTFVAGKVVTLRCTGRIMKTDVVITADDYYDQVNALLEIIVNGGAVNE